VARQFSTDTKFGNEKGKVQKPARIPPQTPPAGGKKAEAGQFHSPRKIVCPAESKLVCRIFVKKKFEHQSKNTAKIGNRNQNPKWDRALGAAIRFPFAGGSFIWR